MKPEDKAYVELGTTFSRGAIGAPVTDTQVEILKMLFSREEAHVAASLDYVHEPEEIIAKRAGVEPEVAADLLTRMASRTLIRGVKRPDGVRVFRTLLFIPGLFEMAYISPAPSVDMPKLGRLFEKYFAEGWGHEMHAHEPPMTRALPPISPPKEQVLPHEDVVKIVERAGGAVQVNCACREASRKCDCPIDICMGVGTGMLGGPMEGMPVIDPQHTVGLPKARPMSIDEAVHTVKRAEEAGLAHITMNFKEDSWLICNCCSHACYLLRGATELDIPHAVAPSSYWTVVEENLCDGCAACEPVCPMLAISIDDHMAEVDYELCLGCGVCINSCPTEALRLEKRGEEIYTPFLDYNELVTARGRTQAIHTHVPVG
jgi:Pyruvate/2-oxoacid:ferredoxin oxidoreductase delta subunit